MIISASESGRHTSLAGGPLPQQNHLSSSQADRINGSDARAILFGPFRLLAAKRLLLHADKPVRLGSRALDILIALVERAGELVSKDELMARVWPSTFVEPANLTVHIAALRRTLGDGRDGNRFLVNIPGRGYRFVALVTFAEDLQTSMPATAKREHNLPTRLTRLIGRTDVIDELAQRLSQRRLLTVAGPGGIGKTAVALAVAEQLIGAYERGVWLIDLASLSDPLLVPSAIASTLGLEVCPEHGFPGLISSLRSKQMLLVLDNCEHLIASAAEVAAKILRGAPNVQILATSREPLRAEGEHLYRLPPLASPPASPDITAGEALGFPAIELFVERAAASSGEFELDDAHAPAVADICRRLDGLPLAIEFAAARVGAIGVRGVAARMEDCLTLLAGGHRTTSPRQQTMRATLDWSYRLLTELEQSILRRLSVFAGGFTLEAAATVAADSNHSHREITDKVLELVAKSLVLADRHGLEPCLRLLETTRTYARIKLTESGERDAIHCRHAEYYRDLLDDGHDLLQQASVD
jgi:predicted ATPase/DNA-binding winged helix-turn-helix (wHTH) protein